MELKRVTSVLERIAPLKLAASWDNVGLLVEPSTPHVIRNIMLTNDLTEGVMEESIKLKVDMIISYHPPIFQPIKRITMTKWKDRLVIKALENRIAIYSPHTSWDAIKNGVNDWLASGLGEIRNSEPIECSFNQSSKKLVTLKLESSPNTDDCLDTLQTRFSNVHVETRKDISRVELTCDEQDLTTVMKQLETFHSNNVQILNLETVPILNTGMGRVCYLQSPTSITDLIKRLKLHLGIPHARLALGFGCSTDDKVQSIALCAGSGSSVLKGVAANVYLTGEMSHHDILDAVANKISVILCEHSNTERGFLHKFKNTLGDQLQDVFISVSEVDQDPLTVV